MTSPVPSPAGHPERPSPRRELFAPERRATTLGMVLLISLVAFEAMGVGTAMPDVVADLGSVRSYSWPFVAFVTATVLGTVAGGRWCDARGPRLLLLVAPLVFGVGLLVAGTAPTMTQLLAGRVLQGVGAGGQGVAVYVLIALVYSPAARPAVFGLISSAWVLPALVGPPVAAVVSERLSWHWVFLGLLPLVVLAVALVAPAARASGVPAHPPPARRGLLPAAVAATAAVAALAWATDRVGVVGVAAALAALASLVPALRVLLPDGALRARPGVAAVVAGRALVSGAFFTANAYLPLLLTDRHGWSLSQAGIPLVVGSLGWSASAAWQARHPALPRTRLLRAGFVGVGAGLAGLLVVTPSWGLAWVAVPAWGLAGLGMGLAFSSLSYLLLQESATATVGFHSSAAQLADQLAQAVCLGLGGGLLAAAGTGGGLPVVLVGLAALTVLGTAIGGRASTLKPSR